MQKYRIICVYFAFAFLSMNDTLSITNKLMNLLIEIEDYELYETQRHGNPHNQACYQHSQLCNFSSEFPEILTHVCMEVPK